MVKRKSFFQSKYGGLAELQMLTASLQVDVDTPENLASALYSPTSSSSGTHKDSNFSRQMVEVCPRALCQAASKGNGVK
jgi:hypothetical protein